MQISITSFLVSPMHSSWTYSLHLTHKRISICLSSRPSLQYLVILVLSIFGFSFYICTGVHSFVFFIEQVSCDNFSSTVQSRFSEILSFGWCLIRSWHHLSKRVVIIQGKISLSRLLSSRVEVLSLVQVFFCNLTPDVDGPTSKEIE